MFLVAIGTIGTVAVSATAMPASASPPAAPEDENVVVVLGQSDPDESDLDQSDSDPPFGSFLGACNDTSDCSYGDTCQSFRKRGSHCTHACESSLSCAGTRCTKQGRCGLNQPVKTVKTAPATQR